MSFYKYLFIISCLVLNEYSHSQELCGTMNEQSRDNLSIYTPLDRDNVEWVDRVIPVIVHILHSGEDYGTFPNVSDEVVYNQIEKLNNVFNGIEYGGYDSKIQFCVANSTNPNHPYAGIQHHNINDVPLIYLNYDIWVMSYYDIIQQEYSVLPDKYCNIYVYDYPSGPNGAASLPPFNSGIIIKTERFVDTNQGMFQTLVHEMGHFLGLQHTWVGGYNTCSDANSESDCLNEGDYVCDTPPTIIHGCENSCDVSDTTILPINFMGYGDICRTSFTYGQIDLMHSVINYYRMDYVTNANFTCDNQVCIWDLDSDGLVSLSDLLNLLTVIYTEQNCENGDLDCDGFVGTIDLLILLSYFSYDCLTGELTIN